MASFTSSGNGFETRKPSRLHVKVERFRFDLCSGAKNLDSIRSASAYADRVVEVRIDFISPGFPTEPISAYL